MLRAPTVGAEQRRKHFEVEIRASRRKPACARFGYGYAVVRDTLPADAELRYSNANDKTAEGIDYSAIPAFSVQFHPEACGGPLDTNFLFDRFMELMSE